MIINYENKPCLVLRKYRAPSVPNVFLYEIIFMNKKIKIRNYMYDLSFDRVYGYILDSEEEIRKRGWEKF